MTLLRRLLHGVTWLGGLLGLALLALPVVAHAINP